jgi:cytochrome c-type biogenesis protein CcmH/NrfF
MKSFGSLLLLLSIVCLFVPSFTGSNNPNWIIGAILAFPFGCIFFILGAIKNHIKQKRIKEEQRRQEADEPVRCPKCGSNQISAVNARGVNLKRALAGGVLAGWGGAVIGGVTGNKIILGCHKCGNQWKPDQQK